MARSPLLLCAALLALLSTQARANSDLQPKFPSRVIFDSFGRFYDDNPPIEALPLRLFEARGPEMWFLDLQIPTIPTSFGGSTLTFDVTGPVAATLDLQTGEIDTDPFDIVVTRFQGTNQIWQDTISAVTLTTGDVWRTCDGSTVMFTGQPLDPNGHVRLVAARCLSNFGGSPPQYLETGWSLEINGPIQVPVFPMGGDW